MPPGGGRSRAGTSPKIKNIKATVKRSLSLLLIDKLRFSLVFLSALLAIICLISGPKIMGNATNTIFNGVVSKMTSSYVIDGIKKQSPQIEALPKDEQDKLINEQLSKMSKDDLVSQLKKTGNNQIADMLQKVDIKLGVNAGIDFGELGYYILLIILVYTFQFMMFSMTNWLSNTMICRMCKDIRRSIEIKLHNLPLNYFDSNTKGDIMSRMSNDLDNLSQSLTQSASQILTSVFQVIAILFMMFQISWDLTLVALCVLPLSAVIIVFLMKKAQPQFVKQWKLTGTINGFVEDAFTGHTEIRLNRQQFNQMKQFDEYNEQLKKATTIGQLISGLIQPITQFISNLGYVLIAILGCLKVTSGSLSLGDVQAFIQYSRQFSMPVGQIANMLNLLQSGMASAERIYEILDTADEVDHVDIESNKEHPLIGIKGFASTNNNKTPIVEFENVSFSYDLKTPLIQNFNFKVYKNDTIAIVGPTGAGKTTIINLLMRFYDVQEGAIKINGVNIKDMSRHELRSMFGMVLQDTWMFNGTIEENLKYGLQKGETVSNEQFMDITKSTFVDQFVQKLPQTYSLQYDDENSILSQGEKQLLTIARASFSNPEILILDEATSSVDTRTETLVYKAMSDLQKDRTSFVIAHRLSTIRNADVIIYIDNGQIVEQGSQDELLALNGKYASLYHSGIA